MSMPASTLLKCCQLLSDKYMEVTIRQNSHYLLVYYNVRVLSDSVLNRSVEETCNICILGYCDQLLSSLYVNWSKEVKPHLYFSNRHNRKTPIFDLP